MEFVHVGAQCAWPPCSQAEFLPVTCVRCGLRFCSEHSGPALHECTGPEQQQHTAAGGDGARPQPRDRFHCTLPGCLTSELTHVVCAECRRGFCIP